MTIVNQILTKKFEEIRQGFEADIETIKRILVQYGPKAEKLFEKLMTSKSFWELFRGTNGISYQPNEYDPIERVSFIRLFMSHEILDDGEPVIIWNRWVYKLGERPSLELCKKNDKNSLPTIIPGPYILDSNGVGTDYTGEYEWADFENTLEALEFLDKSNKETTKKLKKLVARINNQPEPQDGVEDEYLPQYQIDLENLTAEILSALITTKDDEKNE